MKYAGFTLVELLVTVVLVAVISALALPALGKMVDAQRRLNAAQQIASGIRTARAEAIMRNQIVTIHSIDDDWSNGWRIIVDLDGKGPDEDDPVLVERAANGKAKVVGNQKVQSYIRFDSSGGPMSSANGTLFICLEDQPVSHYRVVLALTGRVRIENQEQSEKLCG